MIKATKISPKKSELNISKQQTECSDNKDQRPDESNQDVSILKMQDVSNDDGDRANQRVDAVTVEQVDQPESEVKNGQQNYEEDMIKEYKDSLA